MKKILLIRTSKPTISFQVTQPLGLMYIASYLRRRKRHDIRIIDMRVKQQVPQDIIGDILDYSPDIVGLSSLTYEAPVVHEIARNIKEFNEDCKLVVGGPYPTSSPERVLKDNNIDYVALGEGEVTMGELVQEVEKGNNYAEISGLVFSRNGEIVFTPPRAFIEDLDSIPFPAWDLIDIESYFEAEKMNRVYYRKEYMSIFTSRGCPYNCVYCHNIFGKRFRMRSPENVISEIEALSNNYGIREIDFIDDAFNIDAERAERICDLLIEKGLDVKITFPNGIRGDIISEKLLHKMKEAGTYRIVYGIETASPRLQKLIKKNMNLEKMNKIISFTDRIDILSHGFFMLGFPTETREELQQTIDYAKNSKLHTASFFTVNSFEGTELAGLVKELEIPVDYEQEEHNCFTTNAKLSEVSPAELARLSRKANRVFYLKIRRIYRILMLFPRKFQIFRLFLTFIKKGFKDSGIQGVKRKKHSNPSGGY